MNYQAVQGLLESSKKIVITAHFKPDGDAMGSALGLFHLLKEWGNEEKEIKVVMPSNYPEFLKWLPGNDEVINYEFQMQQAIATINQADLIFCLDYNHLSRVGGMEVYMRNTTCPKIMIDHHLEPEDFATEMLSKTSASSTCELIYEFAQGLEITHLINQDIATSLYLGLVTDTGRFKFALSPEVFNVAASLISKGADAMRINREIYDSFSSERLRFLGFSLSERLILMPEHKAAIIYLKKEDLEQFNFKEGDSEGLVNYPLSIKEIAFSTLLTETPDLVKMSFRSKGNFAVNELARDHFNGGGHKNASGGRSMKSLEATLEKLKGLLPDYQDQTV